MRKTPLKTAVRKRSSVQAALSSTDATVPPRVMLPSDLSTSLKYLDNADLQKLRAAVTAEIDRRAQQRPQSDVSPAVSVSAAIHTDELPEGKANLIRASFRAGLKPAAIARTFHVPPSLVNRVIKSTDKPKR
jgi:hypothetical protein